MAEHQKIKELNSKDKSNDTTLKGKSYCAKGSVVGCTPTGKNVHKFAGLSKNSDAYQKITPVSQKRNARLVTVSKCCSETSEKIANHKQSCGGPSLALQSTSGSLVPTLSGSFGYEDIKLIRRQQYVTNKRVKRSLKTDLCPKNKIYKEHKSKKNKSVMKLTKTLIALPVKEGIELAKSPYTYQSRRVKPECPMWMRYIRPDGVTHGFDLFWFHIENLVSVIHLLKNCNSFKEMGCILNLYLHIYFDISLVEQFIQLFDTCTAKIFSCQSSGLSAFKSLLTNWQAIKESEAARQIYHFISTVLATGLCKVNHINIQVQGLEVFRVMASKKVANMVDLVQVVVETTIFFYERGCAYLSTSNLWDLIYSDNHLVTFEKEFAFVISNEPYAIAGEWSEMNLSSMEYFDLMEKLTSDIVSMLKVSSGPEKNNLTSKLIMLEKTKIKVKRANVAPTMRMKPFGVVLFGGTGVGKSSVLPYIVHYLNKVNDFESSRDRMITLNPAEKYQSEYKSNTNVVILDDIMNQKLEVSEGTPGDLIIRLLNNIPTTALKADVDSKGNVMMAPNFVYGTTNIKTMCANQLSNEPVSILRRFEYYVTMTVKEENKRADSKMLDSSKITELGIPDAWWFKVEYVVPSDVYEGHPASPTFHVAKDGDRYLEKIGIQHLLDFLGSRSKIHFKEQRNFVSKSADVFRMEICKDCNQLDSLCRCSQNENQELEDQSLWPSSLTRLINRERSNDSDEEIPDASDDESEDMELRDLVFAQEIRDHDRLSSREKRQMRYQGLTELLNGAFDNDRIKKAKIRRRNSVLKSDPSTDRLTSSSSINMSSDEDDIPHGLDMSRIIFGKDLPVKTRFEHVRDNTIKGLIKNPFLQSFITGQYNSMFGWSAVCWNFLTQKWKDDKFDCIYFMILLIINSIVITVVTLPITIATKCGICSVQRVDECYSWASVKMTNLILSSTNLANVRVGRIRKIQTAMKLSLYGVSILSMVYIVKKAMSAYNTYNSHTLSTGGSLPVDEVKKPDHWARPVLSKPIVSMKSSTTTSDNLRTLIQNKIGNATLYCTETQRRSQMVIFPLCGNVWVINSHALTGYSQRVDVVIRELGTIGPNFSDIIGVNNTYHIPNNDLALVVLTSGGSQYNFVDFFPKGKDQVRYMCSLLYKGPDASITDQRVLVVPKLIKYQGPRKEIAIQGFHYSAQEPTFEGMCMSPLMTYESKPQIIGFHCCGITGTKEGGAAMLCRDDIELALNTLKNRKGLMVAHSMCPNGLNFEKIGPYETVTLLDELHSKSPFRFLEKGSFTLYGQHSGPRQRASTSVVKTLLSDAITEVFDVPCLWGPPENINNYIPRHKEVIRMCAVSAMDADRMALASHDFCLSIIDTLPASALRGIQPLNREVTLSGQDGISQLRSVVMNTSCGFPINKPKHMVLKRTGVASDVVTDVIEAPDYVWQRVEKCEKLLLEGKRCHFIFKASLKDEPKKIGSGKVRVFAGVSLEGLLIVRKYFLPLGVVIMRNPYPFESAVGINAHGDDWDKLVRHVTKKGKDRMVAGDYAGFDSSMSPTASMAAFSCLLHLAQRCGYSQDDLTVMRGIATEICYPTYDFFGEIVVVSGSEPSGHPMTVFVNNIVNSLYIRYAYYSIYDFDKDNLFNKYVTQMNYGDDNIMSVSEEKVEFNHTAIQRELGKSGVVYTMADKEGVSIPFIKMEDCSFLKRTFRLDLTRDVYLGPLEVMSLYKALHTCVKSDTVTLELQNCDMLSSVLFEAFLQGREFYDDFHQKIVKVLKKCSIVHWFPRGVPSFDFQQEVWDKRYLNRDNELCDNPHGSGVVGDSYIFE